MASSFFSRFVRLGCVAALSFGPLTAFAEPTATAAKPVDSTAATASPTKSDAPRLVAEALAAQLAGNADARDELLRQAIAADPDYAPARWHHGEVRFDGKWRTLEDVHERVAANPHRDEYLEHRATMLDAPMAHADMARWCMRNGLENEERFHWTKVLFADPSHDLARSRLGLRPYQGGLYTQREIADYESKLAAAEVALKKYRPIFAELCRRVTTSESTEREAALAALRQVDDLAQLPALELSIQREAQQAPAADSLDLYLALVHVLGNVPNHEATTTLLNYSLFARSPEVRQAAARSLQSRPVTDYVPQLMAALTSPIEAEITTHASPDGTVSYGEILYQAGPLSDQTMVRGRDFIPVNREGERADARVVNERMNRSRMTAAAMASQARQRVAIANAQAAAGNARIREVLHAALDIDLGDDPKNYWQAWTDYNELVYDEHPIYSYNDVSTEYVPTTHSCFMAGTPVWTQEGMRRIEEIAVGDLVLTQHPDTGELAYRPVLEKTLGPPTQTVAINLPEETIVATLGHRFWVDRQGWEMAKSLKPEMHLHSIMSSLPVASIEPGDRLECRNLVVEGFHTYFVGRSQVLVHDKTCPRPTTSKTPGQGGVIASQQSMNSQASVR